MRRNLVWLVLAVLMLAITGCGSSGDDRVFVETVIASDPAVDGDIVDVAGVQTPIVSLVQRDALLGVRAGVDISNDDVYRAFLHFPLASVPLNARIESATLSMVIRSVTVLPPTASIPIRIELVSFTPPLIPDDFDRILLPPIVSTSIVPPISSLDVNREVVVDVTPLMVEAQFRGLDNFQVRILQQDDFTTQVPGLIEIDEATGANEPLLTVVYF